ncbi:TnsA-like heteromeric transposase endonuclease subunit [Streptomyces sp. URMC 127]|uniref:TnsA-like heteromeric transposase endonuclease subunit n=1 Tax=Streptomyces sp. URMC 127 TaxID=3423402 RepID=UPI003F1ADBD6
METRDCIRFPSDTCALEELVVPYAVGGGVRDRLLLGETWSRRWSVTWRLHGGEVVWAVRDVAGVSLLSSEPVRRFSWRAGQRHRPGLQFMVSTGRHHGFESLEEQRLLLALDFVTVVEVLPQPFLLSFEHAGGRGSHTPDFLAVMPSGGLWLFDVRPRQLVHESDELKFAAAAEMAAACGWHYTVVSGWQPHVQSTLDQLSAQRRPLEDPLALQGQLEVAVDRCPGIVFGDLVDGTSLPAVARAHALHLLWHRRLAVDLGRPLGDGSPVWEGRSEASL